MFTGNLNRKIHSNPDFNGEERHLLRCMIGRIYHGAKLVPSINHYTIEDQEAPYKTLTPAEKPKKFTNEILNDLNYIWNNDWNEGYDDVEVLGYISVADVDVLDNLNV